MARSWRLWPFAAALAVYACLAAPIARTAALYDHEAWHAEATMSLMEPRAPGVMIVGDLPWMRDSYNGALKTYLLYPALELLGPTTGAIRLTTLAFGAVALVLTMLLIGRLCGEAAAAAAGLVLASDPALVLCSVFDVGPQILMLALKMGALSCLFSWRDRPNDRLAPATAGLLLGLALWDKTHFAWFLAALALSGAAAFGGEAVFRKPRAWGALVAGLVVGCLPLLVYNVAHPAHTLESPGHWLDVRQHFSHLGAAAADRASLLLRSVEGSEIWNICGVAIPGSFLAQRRLAWAALALLGLVAAPRRAGRLIGFWLGLAALVFAFAVVSPLPVKFHHLFLDYPFPYLALACAFGGGRTTRIARAARIGAAAICAFLVISQAGLLHERFLSDYALTGGVDFGRAEIASVVERLEAYHRESPSAPIAVGEDLARRLRFYTRGRIAFATIPEDEDDAPLEERIRALREAARGLAIVTLAPDGDLSERLRDALRWAAMEAKPAGSVSRADGSAWVGFYALSEPVPSRKVRPRASKGAATLARLPASRGPEPAFQRGNGDLPRVLLDVDHGDFGSGERGTAHVSLAASAYGSKIASSGPGRAEDWLALARDELDHRNADGARRALEQARARAPAPDEEREIARLWETAGDPSRAEAGFKRLEKNYGGEAGYWLERARAANESGARDEAAQDLTSAMKRPLRASERRATARLWLDLAKEEVDHGNKGAASRCLTQAEKLDLDDDDAHRAAVERQELGEYAHAVSILDRLIAKNELDPGLFTDRAVSEALLGRSAQAGRDLRRALALDPSYAPAARTLEELRREH